MFRLYARDIEKLNGCKKLKQYSVDCIGAGAGVSEPGLNRWPDKKFTPKIWRRT